MSKQFHDGFGNIIPAYHPGKAGVNEHGTMLNANGHPSVFGGEAFEVGKAIDTRGADEIGTVDDCMADACVEAFKLMADAARKVLNQMRGAK